MTSAVIYARFSSDLQRDRSIEDQVELCRDFARRNGWQVTRVYEDRARSGASIFGRDGVLSLMEAARAGEFDVVIVEALDRLSRDQEDLAGIFKRLTFAGVEIRAVHDGKADQVQIGIRGLVGALYLQDLSHKVRRGMAGVTRDGRHAGGRAYGYRPIPGKPGELVIVEEEAAVVRRIFAAYVAGERPRGIVAALNADGIPPPRGRYWTASALNGNKARGHGILVNPIYSGTIVWNRVRMVKDPETGKRVSRTNPTGEWQRSSAPHLAIVDPEVFEEAQTLIADRAFLAPAKQRRPKHLLSGLLKCGVCGSGMVIKDRSAGRVRLQCSAAKEGSACKNTRAVYLNTIEPVVVGGLKERLRDKQAIAAYVTAYNEERRALAADAVRNRASAERRLAKAKANLDRALGQTISGLISEEEARERLPPLRAAKAAAETELATTDEPPKIIELHPTAIVDYLATIDKLEEALREKEGEPAPSASKPVRDLVEKVLLHPEANGGWRVEVHGQLTRLIGGRAFPHMDLGLAMVAEEGFEPPTHGL